MSGEKMSNPNRIESCENSVVATPLPDGVLKEQDVGVVLRDGIRLSANVYRPEVPGRYPVIMAISPYGKDYFSGFDFFMKLPGNSVGNIRISDQTAFEAPDPGFWVPHGYVVIQVDTRGQGLSEGDLNSFSAEEQQDYMELIDWASTQPWSCGNVGLCGVSFLAITQWGVAQHRPPALRAIIPWEGWNEPFHRKSFGGIPEVKFRRFVTDQWVTPHHNPAGGYVKKEGADDPANHPFLDDFWLAQTPALEKISVPALVCASFSDQELHTRDSFSGFNRLGSEQKWLYNHRQPKWHAFYSKEALDIQLRFFDRFLKGRDTGIEDQPRVRLEINQDRTHFVVYHADAWPPREVEAERLYLDTRDMALKTEAPGAVSVVTYDAVQGQATFSYSFDTDTNLVGNMRLRLWVEARGSEDMDLFVGIRKFDRDGNEVYFYGFAGNNSNDIVSRGWLRASRRELDEKHSTELRPVHLHKRDLFLSPGEVVPVEIELMPSGTRFLAGEKLAVTVQGRVIEPHHSLIEHDHLRNKGLHCIYTGTGYDSYLVVPVLSGALA